MRPFMSMSSRKCRKRRQTARVVLAGGCLLLVLLAGPRGAARAEDDLPPENPWTTTTSFEASGPLAAGDPRRGSSSSQQGSSSSSSSEAPDAAALSELLESARRASEEEADERREAERDAARAADAERAHAQQQQRGGHSANLGASSSSRSSSHQSRANHDSSNSSDEETDGSRARRGLLAADGRRRPRLSSSSGSSGGAKSAPTEDDESSSSRAETKPVPHDLRELYGMIRDGERSAREEAMRAEAAARLANYGSLDPKRRAERYAALPARERRAMDAEVNRILRAEQAGYYAVLGVRRSCKASAIKQRFRSKAMVVHPDKNPGERAPDAFDALRVAHETLADPAARRKYDRRLQKKALVRRTRWKRRASELVDTAKEYVGFRSKEMPVSFFAAFLLALSVVLL